MSLKFAKLTRPSIRKLSQGEKVTEHGIIFERLPNGDGRYTVNIMVDGLRIHRAIGRESEGVTRKQAEDFIEKVKTDSRAGRLNLPKGRKVVLGFKEAAEKYLVKLKEEGGKDLKAKKMRLTHHLVPFFKGKPLSNISTFDIKRYKKSRLDAEISPGTINRELAVISHIFSKALEWGWINHKPVSIKRLKENPGRIVYLTPDQIERLLQAAGQNENPQIYPFMRIGLATSMRKMEILSIKISDISIQRKNIFIPNSKTGARNQPITNELAGFLTEYIEALQSQSPGQRWLFPSDKSETGHTVAIEKAFRRAVKRAGLNENEIVRHTLRHTAITHLVQAGVDLPT